MDIDVSHAERLRAWLTLLHAPGVGAATFNKLIEHFESPTEVLALDADSLRGIGLKVATINWLTANDRRGVERDLEWCGSAADHHILTLADEGYPKSLRHIANPPPVLFAKGQLDLLNRTQLAIVGSRNPSAGGRSNAKQFAAALSRQGYVITSGLALGVDAAAHEGALAAAGKTVAVMGTGLDRVYPARHRELAVSIRECGVLVSEFPIGSGPRAEHFPRRNRIISGLSLGVLVVEAAPQSGSLITARMALEQDREVFAIPGSIHNPLARGCHALIRQGAKLVESVDDIMEELPPQVATASGVETTSSAHTEVSEAQQHLLTHMGYDPVSIDVLVDTSRLTADELSSMLLLMELQGLVTSMPGGLYVRTN